MFSRLYFKFRYGSYLKSEHGVKKFAEMCMGQLIRRVTKKSAFYREMNENLLVEKANLRLRADELYEQPMLKAGQFFSVRRRLLANSFIITAVMLAAVFLIYISISAFIQTETGMAGFLSWVVSAVLAVVLAGGGLIVAERLIETLIPRRTPVDEQDAGSAIGVLWAVLLVGIELSILGLTDVRADRLATSQESPILYYAFVAIAMMLPIVAGAIRWDAMRYIDAFKTTRAHRDIDSRLAQIDSILRQNEEYESNFYKIKSISYWDLLNEFKTYKDLYNQKHDVAERLDGHFSRTYDEFQREAYQRYNADIRDLNARSMRRLESAVGNSKTGTGSKIGQAVAMMPSNGDGTRRPAADRVAADRDADSVSESNLYLSPKPIH